jgi:hypothetical protein
MKSRERVSDQAALANAARTDGANDPRRAICAGLETVGCKQFPAIAAGI